MNKLKEIRSALGLTQQELADKAGVTRITIYNIENGKNDAVMSDTLLKIADALNVPVEKIYF